MIRALYDYRHFIWESIKRDFLSRYAKSVFGSIWAVLNPLSMIIVYAFIFTEVMRARLPGIDSSFSYSIYICAGLIPWGMFIDVSSRSVGMFIEYANVLKKVKIPKVCLPVIIVGSSLINFLIMTILFIIFLLLIDFWPGAIALYAIPIVLIMLIMAVSIGIFLGTINVFLRDIGQFYGILSQFWFWLTPIVYPATIVPENFKAIMGFNPIYPLITGMHDIFLEHKIPDFLSILPIAICTIIFAVLVLYFFRRHSEEIVDEL